MIHYDEWKLAMALFDGKVSIVTGGGSGIGRATALAFAREGARVAIADNNVDGGKQTAKLIHDRLGEALFVETDVSVDRSVAAFVSQTIDQFGRLDCAANIAGVTQPAMPLAETPEELFDRVMAINAKSIFLCLRHEISAMLPTSNGAIVNMASTLGLVGTAGMAFTAPASMQWSALPAPQRSITHAQASASMPLAPVRPKRRSSQRLHRRRWKSSALLIRMAASRGLRKLQTPSYGCVRISHPI